ncbi:hypothetical protein C8Q77DRAFT_306560 [Trametes polyzona]|nr:hypothetical protein C8Q77DRAFT_306560 [Trametes polyzona]
MVLEEAWDSIPLPDPDTRWKFFRILCLVDSRWREVAIRVVTRHVKVCLLSSEDLAAYLSIGHQALRPGTIRPPTPTHPQVVDYDRGGLTDKVYQHSSVHLHILHPRHIPPMPFLGRRRVVFGRGVVQIDPNVQLENDAWFAHSELEAYMRLLRGIVPNGRKVTVATNAYELGQGTIYHVAGYIACLQSATYLDFDTALERPGLLLDMPLPSSSTPGTIDSFIPSLPNIRCLRFRVCPECDCERLDEGCTHPKSHCPNWQLMSAFTNLERLHIDNPVFLKHIIPPTTLRTLTLEASPASLARSGSIVGYNISSALRRGLFGAKVPAEQQCRTVIINTSTDDDKPVGWIPAAKACQDHGIALVQRRRTEPYRGYIPLLVHDRLR